MNRCLSFTLIFLSSISVSLFTGCGSSTETAVDTGSSGTASQQPSTKVDDGGHDTPATKTPATGSGSGAMGTGMGTMTVPPAKDIKFKDKVASNVEPPVGLDGLIFIDTNNKRVQLSDYTGKKNVVLVFTEGFSGMLCPFCKTQTSRLVANYDKFKKLNTQVLVVYPGERDHVEEFIAAAKKGVDKRQVKRVPFPIVLDPKLSAVEHFDIRSKLAHPSTYVIDKNGKIQLAYVGKDMSPDRPSIKALLETLEGIENRN